MAFARRDIRGGAVQTTISAGIASGATSCAIVASTGWPDGSVNGPFYVVIDPGLSTEEKILCATRTALTLNFTTRGADGSTASAHASGAVCYPILAAVDADEANYTTSQTVGKVTAASDLLIGSGTNTLARLAKGSNSTVLAVDSGGTLGYTTVTSAMIADGTIVSGDIADGTIVNADVNASAAIATTKINPDPAVALTTHTGNATGAHAASAISFAATGTIAAINVQTAIAEVATEAVQTTRQVISGGGLTGGGALSGDLTLAVGAGTGITVNADDIALDSTKVDLGATNTTWTATWGGTAANVGNAVVSKRWYRQGRMITFWYSAVFGTTTVMSSAGSPLTILLPVAAVSPGSFKAVIGTGYYEDTSGSVAYHGVCWIDHNLSSTVMYLGASLKGVSNYNLMDPLDADTPFAWSAASTSRLFVTGSYESAT